MYTTNKQPAKGTYTGGALSPCETTNEKNLAGAALTAPATSCNNTEEGKVTTRSNYTAAVANVTNETALDTSVEAPPSVRDKIVTAIEGPEETPDSDVGSAADENLIEEITAEEIMAKHAEQAPTMQDGFTLDEVVATDQVVPINLARTAGVSHRKPNDKEFIRVSKNPGEIMPFDILEIDNNSKYIVTPTAMAAINKLHEEMGRVLLKTKRQMLHLTVNMDGVGFLWPITVMDDNNWVDSAHNCATIAKDQWIRIVSNQSAQRYDYHLANKKANVVPKWPKETFTEMLNLAFKDKLIRSLDHPAIKHLLDE
jgi:hypothetical protein